ncbi:hypothetical protein [Dyella sp. A6]|uniref:hypothetical protein n=1 Tax=Dyella aluminiiresistens TaxID=3069105 RepID=UPI002E77596E|nr:hypothetical protein [Dyella sp. A6]
MIELEIQTLSVSRDGLLAEVGGAVVETGFTLLRQRIVQDRNGVLLTMVVRGHPRRKRALESALDACERLISYEISLFEADTLKPHFAASRSYPQPPLPPRPEPAPAPAMSTRSSATPVSSAPPAQSDVLAEQAMPDEPELVPPAYPLADTELLSLQMSDFMLATPPTAPAPAAEPELEPYAEVVPLEADTDAIDIAWPRLTKAYPQIFPTLQSMLATLAEGAREATLHEVGRRLGTWVLQRRHASGRKLSLASAIEQIGLPDLSELVVVEHVDGHLHIRNSPLCTPADGQGCSFFGGYLEGLLGPVVTSQHVSSFSLCCRSFRADACVLAISES